MVRIEFKTSVILESATERRALGAAVLKRKTLLKDTIFFA